jgi:anti-sigma factor RsiW
MKPVQPEELSALLDGELDSERAREVEMQIAADPQLRAEFDALSWADARWRAAAATAVFAPAVELPTRAGRASWIAFAAALTGGLVCLRVAPKLVESLAFGFGLHAISFAALLAALAWLARADRGGLASPN